MQTQIDLFEHQETLPKEMQELLNAFNLMDNDYKECEAFLKAINKLGYTFEYGLDCILFNLQKL